LSIAARAMAEAERRLAPSNGVLIDIRHNPDILVDIDGISTITNEMRYKLVKHCMLSLMYWDKKALSATGENAQCKTCKKFIFHADRYCQLRCQAHSQNCKNVSEDEVKAAMFRLAKRNDIKLPSPLELPSTSTASHYIEGNAFKSFGNASSDKRVQPISSSLPFSSISSTSASSSSSASASKAASAMAEAERRLAPTNGVLVDIRNNTDILVDIDGIATITETMKQKLVKHCMLSLMYWDKKALRANGVSSKCSCCDKQIFALSRNGSLILHDHSKTCSTVSDDDLAIVLEKAADKYGITIPNTLFASDQSASPLSLPITSASSSSNQHLKSLKSSAPSNSSPFPSTPAPTIPTGRNETTTKSKTALGGILLTSHGTQTTQHDLISTGTQCDPNNFRTVATQTKFEAPPPSLPLVPSSSPPPSRSQIKSHVTHVDSTAAAFEESIQRGFEEATRRLKPSATGSYPDLRKNHQLLANIPNLGKSSLQ